MAAEGSDESHENRTSGASLPFASKACATSRSVSPGDSAALSGETVALAARCATVTEAAPDADPAAAVTAVLPLATAVTSPEALAVATAGAPLDHVTAAPAMTLPYWSSTSAESCTVAPTAVSSAESGLTATVVGRGGSATVICARAEALPDVASTSVAPALTPVTSPDASTLATDGSWDAHENAAPGTWLPFASKPCAANRIVSPVEMVAASGSTAASATSCATVTDAEPNTDPAAAVILALPLATAVTTPEASAVATDGAPLVHVTAAPDMTLPYWSSTSADSCTVAPSAVSSAEAGLTVTLAGRGGSGATGGGPPSPHAMTSRATASGRSRRAGERGVGQEVLCRSDVMMPSPQPGIVEAPQ